MDREEPDIVEMGYDETVEAIEQAIDRHTTYRHAFQACAWVAAGWAVFYLYFFTPSAVVLSAVLTFACTRLAELHQELVVMWKIHLRLHKKDDDEGYFI
jgi:uncharacterized membrane protein YdbT with pleckstrin-like domain